MLLLLLQNRTTPEWSRTLYLYRPVRGPEYSTRKRDIRRDPLESQAHKRQPYAANIIRQCPTGTTVRKLAFISICHGDDLGGKEVPCPPY